MTANLKKAFLGALARKLRAWSESLSARAGGESADKPHDGPPPHWAALVGGTTLHSYRATANAPQTTRTRPGRSVPQEPLPEETSQYRETGDRTYVRVSTRDPEELDEGRPVKKKPTPFFTRLRWSSAGSRPEPAETRHDTRPLSDKHQTLSFVELRAEEPERATLYPEIPSATNVSETASMGETTRKQPSPRQLHYQKVARASRVLEVAAEATKVFERRDEDKAVYAASPVRSSESSLSIPTVESPSIGAESPSYSSSREVESPTRSERWPDEIQIQPEGCWVELPGRVSPQASRALETWRAGERLLCLHKEQEGARWKE